MSYGYGSWKPYVPVAERRAQAARQVKKLTKAGQTLRPVSLKGQTIARTFWGKGWCKHLEAFSDFSNRLPRGRSYVRNGSVCHLAIDAGRIEALVMGSSMYRVTVEIGTLPLAAWAAIKQKCSGEIGSLLELLQGRVSDQVMRVVTDRTAGLFPQPGQMKFTCSCPDWAGMCKHVAAVLYGVGSQLDEQPQLLFLLRDVDAGELIGASLNVSTAAESFDGRLADDQLGAIFGIDLEAGDAASAVQGASRKRAAARVAPPKKQLAQSGVAGSEKPSPAPVVASDFRATAKSIAALRKKYELSVPKFAARLSVSQASVQRWETTHGTLHLHNRCLAALAAMQKDMPGARKAAIADRPLQPRRPTARRSAAARMLEQPEREDRINSEIVDDAYGESERAMSWYYYLEEQFDFPFKARCCLARATTRLTVGSPVEVVGMAPEDDCTHEVFVLVKRGNAGKSKLAVPLAQLECVRAPADTRQAVADWHYWVARGYAY